MKTGKFKTKVVLELEQIITYRRRRLFDVTRIFWRLEKVKYSPKLHIFFVGISRSLSVVRSMDLSVLLENDFQIFCEFLHIAF